MKINFIIIMAFLGMVLVSGCTKTATTGSRAAPYDSITMEATVLSLSKYDSCLKNEEVCSTDTVPRDQSQIRIDKIIDYSRNSEVKYDTLVEGQELSVQFQYSARPAKVRCITIPEAEKDSNMTQSNEKKVPQKLSDEEIEKLNSVPKEDGYYVYTYYTGQCPKEKVLEGISEGNKIQFNLEFQGNLGNLHIKEYDILS